MTVSQSGQELLYARSKFSFSIDRCSAYCQFWMTFGLMNFDPGIFKYAKFDEDWPKITPPVDSLNLIGPIWASGGYIVSSNNSSYLSN